MYVSYNQKVYKRDMHIQIYYTCDFGRILENILFVKNARLIFILMSNILKRTTSKQNDHKYHVSF